MKIIINRGIGKFLTRIIVFKNAKEIISCPIHKDYLEFDSKEGDLIVIKLKALDTTTSTVASFISHESDEILYVRPTTMYRIWEFINYGLLPFVCLLLFVLRNVIVSNMYERFCTGMIVLMALSLICLQCSSLNSSMRKRMFRLDHFKLDLQ